MREYGAENGRNSEMNTRRGEMRGQGSAEKRPNPERPAGYDRKPKMNEQRPKVNEHKPKINEQKPKMVVQKPEMYERKPEHIEPMRINKFLSDAGYCSRREADRLIEMGKVTVDGIPAEMGTKVLPGQRVCVIGKPVRIESEDILLVVNKPIGIVCTTAEFDKDNIVDFINYPKRVYPIGRLDKDSSGLILMTNQGELVNKILRGGNNHEKEYMVRVNRPVTPEFVAAMEAGVVLDDGVRTLPCRVEKTGGYSFKIILRQGLNRQLRRMCEALDYRVTNLKRVRVMNIELGDLRVGSYRKATPEEYRELRRLLEDSTNLSWAEAQPLGLVRGPEERPVPVKKKAPVTRPISERKPALEKSPISEKLPGLEKRPISGKKPPVYEIPPQPRPRLEKKSVIKRGEIKPTSGKNIVIRRPDDERRSK